MVRLSLVVLTLGAVLSPFAPSPSAAARPAPPAGFETLFQEFNHIEAEIEAGTWARTRDHFGRIQEKIAAMLPELKKAAGEDVRTTFVPNMERLKTAIARENREASETYYREARNAFILLLDKFEFPTPIVLSLLTYDLDEVLEGVETKDFKEIGYECAELKDSLALGVDDLTGKGVAAAEISL
jgi:hypothetical protein